ncbi:MAG TPA: hypothetical protein VGJ21_04695 [Terracidiphilus sp.]
MKNDRGLLEVALADGRLLIALVGVCLLLAGGGAILQSASGHLLPQDSHAIGMDAEMLSHAANPRLLGFMFHDRVAYGGTLLAIGFGYLWLSAFPLAGGERWAWWALFTSGAVGFLAFLTYLRQGYLDTWHGVATLFLLPVFVGGLWRTRPGATGAQNRPAALPVRPNTTAGRWGRVLLGFCAVGLVMAGLTIAIFGMTTVFVPSDLRFIGLGPRAIASVSPMLIPVIAHDRSGFGGGLCSIGCLLLFMARCAELNRSFVEIVFVMGCCGFGAAIGVHFVVGYVDFMHLLPAFVGFAFFLAANALLWMGWRSASAQMDESGVSAHSR